MRVVAFHQLAYEQYNEWAIEDKRVFERLRRLITEAAKTPFAGIGEPEPLKGNLTASQMNIDLFTKRPMTN